MADWRGLFPIPPPSLTVFFLSLQRELSPGYIANATPFKHEKLSNIIDQFYVNLTDENSTTFLDETIPPTAFMVNATHKPNAPELLHQLNTVLAMYGNDQNPISLQYSGIKQLNYLYRVTKFFAKVIVNIRRLFLTFNFSTIIFNCLLALSLYPIMALLLLRGLKANDLFLGICFLVFFPFMFVTVACASSMAEVYRLLIVDVEDGIYSALSLQTAFMTYFTFSSLIICVTSLGAIFVVRPDTVWMDLYQGLMILNLDMIFFLGMIYFCVVACQGDPGLVCSSSFIPLSFWLISFFLPQVFRNVTILLTFCTLFGGLLINIYKFPDFIKPILQVNPLFISAATNQYIFIDSCTLIYGDENFCRSFMMTAFGYFPYSEPGLGNGIILAWGIFFNLLAWIVLLFQQSATGVYINETTDDGMVVKIMSSMSLKSNSTKSLSGPMDGSAKEPTSTSQKSLSNIKSLPRMIQQKSQLSDLDEDAASSSSSIVVSDSSAARTKKTIGRAVSLPDNHPHPSDYLAAHQKDDEDFPPDTQLRKVQSMLVSLPSRSMEEPPTPLHQWEIMTGVKGLPSKPPESNPRLNTLDKLRKESGSHSNSSSGLSLVETKEPHPKDDDLEKFLSDNEVIRVDDDEASDDDIQKTLGQKISPKRRKSHHSDGERNHPLPADVKGEDQKDNLVDHAHPHPHQGHSHGKQDLVGTIDPESVRQRINNFKSRHSASSGEYSGSQAQINSTSNSAEHLPSHPETEKQQQLQPKRSSHFFPETSGQPLPPSSDKFTRHPSRSNSKEQTSSPKSSHGNSSEHPHHQLPRKKSLASSNGSLTSASSSPRHHRHTQEKLELGNDEGHGRDMKPKKSQITLQRQSSRKDAPRSQLSFREKKAPPQVIKSDPNEMVAF